LCQVKETFYFNRLTLFVPRLPLTSTWEKDGANSAQNRGKAKRS
jgi:hypothetical protein